MIDYTTEYAKKVVSGEILACSKLIKACERHLNDLERQKTDDFPYFFSAEQANKVIEFIEILPDVKTMKTFPLGEFQKFIVGSLYGWRRVDNESMRKYQKAFVSMARKNGKSILVAGIALYEFLFGKEPTFSRQIYCTANDKKQASIVFTMIAKQLSALQAKDEWVKSATKRVREEIKNLDDWSYIRPLSRETGTVDGFEPYLGILDEYAASKTTEMMELLESGQGQLKNPLTFIISTAGFDLNAPMHTIEYPYAKKVLNGEITDERYFAFIAEQESVEEVDQEESWIKSNPILSVDSLRNTMISYLKKRQKEGKEKGIYNSVLVKNFNMWRQAEEDSYMDIETWEKAQIEPPDIYGKTVYFGVDVGRTSDLFAISWLVPCEEGYWFADSYAFVATKYGLAAKIKADRLDYQRLESMGQCEITQMESGVIDFERVYDWLTDFVETNNLDVRAVCFDPAQYGPLLTQIEKGHPEWQQIAIRQGTLTLSMPTKQFRDDVMAGKIKHSGNEVLTGAVNNAVLLSDNNGVRIDKNKHSNKIDALDALLDAYAICFREDIDGYINDDYVMEGDFGF